MPKKTRKQSIPSNALRLSQLAERGGTPTPPSGHTVKKVNFLSSSGLKGFGFLKYCDATYPPLLAKYVVGISQLYRMSLGDLASDERLVYDSTGTIVGTVSVALEGFIPMACSTETLSTEPDVRRFEAPDPHTLISENIAKLLVASWRNKEDDLHPKNLSLNGRIDFDMSWYHILSIIKGERAVCGLLQERPAQGTKLLAADLHNFPELKSTRTHWPTRIRPGNLNVLKAYQAQESFCRLKHSAKFRNQMFTALLHELLSFQPARLASLLHAYLGEEGIELSSLAAPEGAATASKSKKEQLLTILSPETFYEDPTSEKERCFAEHFALIAKKEYHSFYKIVVNYPEFREFLVKHPEAYLEVRAFYEKNNEQYPRALQYDLVAMEETYQKIWRDSAVREVITLLQATREEYENIRKDIDLSTFLSFSLLTPADTPAEMSAAAASPPALEAPARGPTSPGLTSKRRSSSSSSEEWLLSALPEIITEEPQSDSDPHLKKIRNAIANLYENIHQQASHYFELEKPTQDDNERFVAVCDDLLTRIHMNLKTIPGGDTHRGSKKIIEKWHRLLAELRMDSHVQQRTEYTHSATRIRYVAPMIRPQPTVAPILDSTIDNMLKDALLDWLLTQSLEDVVEQINRSLQSYAPTLTTGFFGALNPFAYTRTRSMAVESLISKARKEHFSAEQLILTLFLDEKAGWTSTSLNPRIMENLLIKMLADFTVDVDAISKYPGLLKLNTATQFASFQWLPHIQKVKEAMDDTMAQKVMSCSM